MALALKPGPFANNIYLRPLVIMHELKLRAANYIRMEEMKILRTKFCIDLQPVERKTEKVFQRGNPRPREPRPP